jgi:hypothetical protein
MIPQISAKNYTEILHNFIGNPDTNIVKIERRNDHDQIRLFCDKLYLQQR